MFFERTFLDHLPCGTGLASSNDGRRRALHHARGRESAEADLDPGVLRPSRTRRASTASILN
jgi:hypothetical protein